MSFPLLLQGVGSIGLFASRAFLPAFVTAMVLRFGPEIPWIAGTGLLGHVRGVPTWFTHDVTLLVLGVLAALELVAERVPEVRTSLKEVHEVLKVGMAALTFFGVLGATDAAFVQELVPQAGVADSLPMLLVAGGVFVAARARGAVVGALSETDEDDDLGLQGLLRRVEDLWAGLGPIALILLPLATIALLGLTVVVLALVQRRVEARQDARKAPCPKCGEPIFAGAPTCPQCRAAIPSPRAVGLLGQALARPADPASQSLSLVAVKRCPVCATRFDRRAVRQDCPSCGHRLMEDPRFVREYIRFIDRRVPLVCALCFLMGLVPVLGVIPGVIIYRLAIVAPLRRYIPPGRALLLRWGVRLTIVALVAFQWVPVAGGFALPLMALINYGAYRKVYQAQLRHQTVKSPGV
ncbi:hypothetical protein BH23PLA1_BH23PLA1_27690 [soil metagenome]